MQASSTNCLVYRNLFPSKNIDSQVYRKLNFIHSVVVICAGIKEHHKIKTKLLMAGFNFLWPWLACKKGGFRLA